MLARSSLPSRWAKNKSQRNWWFIQNAADVPKNFERRRAVSGVRSRRPFTRLFTRWKETPIRLASSDWVSPRGSRNSSRSISPGCVGARCVGTRTMASSTPMLPFSIPLQCLQMVAGGNSKILDGVRIVEYEQLGSRAIARISCPSHPHIPNPPDYCDSSLSPREGVRECPLARESVICSID